MTEIPLHTVSEAGPYSPRAMGVTPAMPPASPPGNRFEIQSVSSPASASARSSFPHGRVPVSTYRLQLQRDFTFNDARKLIPYLTQLGITDCYCSPWWQAKPGSSHGYDICDHNRLNSELGSEADFEQFISTLQAHHMGLIVDFVPNHMAVDPTTNQWWRDVLENGPASPFAYYFDIDWDPVKPELKGKVLLPFLGDHYGLILERGELQLHFVDGTVVLQYGCINYPIDPKTLLAVFRPNLDMLQSDLKPDDPALLEFLSILTVLDHLPARSVTIADRIAERHRETRLARERLARLVDSSSSIRAHVEHNLRDLNGCVGEPASFDRLHALLEAQAYRLAYWKTAFDEINYRRFFDISDLAGLRMENPNVFAATHQAIFRLIQEGTVSGLRLDHLDGLFDPAKYLQQLREATSALEDKGAERRLYVVVEKILSGDEALPLNWPVEGTTGYDFLNDLNRVFVASQNARTMQGVYQRFTGTRTPFADVVFDSKRLIMRTAMASELNVLAFAMNRISERNRCTRDFTLNSLRAALREVVACFPVYRTYVNAAGASPEDRHMIDRALRQARRRNPAGESSIFDFIRSALLPNLEGPDLAAEQNPCLHFAMKFQQYTGPVQAKGIEDTAFYRYNLLVSLNEVGGDPSRFGSSPAEFHDRNQHRRKKWPHGMLATATHDTKRGEDARARLNVLSELPHEWRRQLFQWSRINAAQRTVIDGEVAPDRNDEYLYYQALLGVWPPSVQLNNPQAPPYIVPRVRDYMLKAVKEAKVHTSWINPNEGYDRAVVDFVERTLTGPKASRFLTAFLPFQQRIARLGMVNSLAQLVLKLVSPGVPDFYQGSEVWDLSLVDPDNRHSIDFGKRQKFLTELEPFWNSGAEQLRDLESETAEAPDLLSALAAMLEHWEDGRVKLYVTACGLRLRRMHPDLFLHGDYLPLHLIGEQADRAIAFARRRQNNWVIAVVPRLTGTLQPAGLAGKNELPIGTRYWHATELALPDECRPFTFRNAFTGEQFRGMCAEAQPVLPLERIFRLCPFALLHNCEP